MLPVSMFDDIACRSQKIRNCDSSASKLSSRSETSTITSIANLEHKDDSTTDEQDDLESDEEDLVEDDGEEGEEEDEEDFIDDDDDDDDDQEEEHDDKSSHGRRKWRSQYIDDEATESSDEGDTSQCHSFVLSFCHLLAVSSYFPLHEFRP